MLGNKMLIRNALPLIFTLVLKGMVDFVHNNHTYGKSTSIWHFEQYNQQLSNLICQNCDGSIKILLDVGNQQHAV